MSEVYWNLEDEGCPDMMEDEVTNTMTYCYLVERHTGSHEGQTDFNEIVNWD